MYNNKWVFFSLYIFLSNRIELLCLLTYYLVVLSVELHVNLHVSSIVTTNDITTSCYTFVALLGSLLGKIPSHKMLCVLFSWELKKIKCCYNKLHTTTSFNLLFCLTTKLQLQTLELKIKDTY